MKLNRIKSMINIMLVAACSLSGITHAMERKSLEERRVRFKDQQNLVTPYVKAAGAFAVARYVPEMAEVVLPRVMPENYALAHALVPQAIKYGAYGFGAHLVLKNGLGINYSDLLKAKYLRKATINTVKATPHFAPALLCHPHVAQMAAGYCIHAATPYLSDSQIITLDKYTVPALMTIGALGTVYLVNRNVFNGKLLEKAKRVWKDIRPYSFIAPLVLSYKADEAKEYVTSNLPGFLGKNLTSDVGSGLKAGLYWGGIGLAAYLFTTQSLDIATQSYVTKKIEKLLLWAKELRTSIVPIKDHVAKANDSLHLLQADQTVEEKALREFSELTKKTISEISAIVAQLATHQNNAETAMASLEKNNENLVNQAKSVGKIAAEISNNLQNLKAEHEAKMQKFRATMKDNSDELLKRIAEKNKEVEEKIAILENACRAEAQELTQLQPKLAELIQLLHEEGQTYHIDQQNIVKIAEKLQQSSMTLDEMMLALKSMHTALQGQGKSA